MNLDVNHTPFIDFDKRSGNASPGKKEKELLVTFVCCNYVSVCAWCFFDLHCAAECYCEGIFSHKLCNCWIVVRHTIAPKIRSFKCAGAHNTGPIDRAFSGNRRPKGPLSLVVGTRKPETGRKKHLHIHTPSQRYLSNHKHTLTRTHTEIHSTRPNPPHIPNAIVPILVVHHQREPPKNVPEKERSPKYTHPNTHAHTHRSCPY